MELWVRSKKFDNYEASSEGRIRNKKTGRILKTQVGPKGYMKVTLHKDKIPYTVKVHRFIADTFYDGEHDGLDVNHEDGNKQNNKISNLYFCTRKENIRHAFDTGLKKPSRQIKIRIVETDEEFESVRACARAINGNQSAILRCLAGKENTCRGYHFEKID